MAQTNKEQQTTAEEKGAAFLQWIADNQKELKKAVKKNCTFDAEIFDDVFAEAIINVYNTITKNNSEIANIKNYFFLACKWQYQMRQNQHRKHTEETIRDVLPNLNIIDEIEDETAKENDYNEAITTMREVLTEQFGGEMADVFFVYWQGKMSGEIANIGELCDRLNLDPRKAKNALQQMRRYIVEEMPYIKNLFTRDYADN